MEDNIITSEVSKACEVLSNGGIILYPTDTIWGIGADATNEEAVAQIFKIKKRNADKSLIVLLPDLRNVAKYVAEMPLGIEDVYDSFIEPTTVIYPKAINLADNVLNQDGTVAIRIPNDVFCKRLLKKYGKPIVSTSANVSGEPSPSIFSEIKQDIIDQMDYVVKHRQEDMKKNPPSRILKWNDDGTYEYIR